MTKPIVENAAPFLKWAGGKQRLLSQYQPYFPPQTSFHRYYEPFIGGAAVFFHNQYAHATLSDKNQKLIELYQMVQQDVDGVIRALQPHQNDADYFYAIRAQNPATLSPPERAARLIYLNKTCYNGLFRENSRGEFNVPFGRYTNPTICNEERLRTAALALQGVRLLSADFAEAVIDVGKEDFVYFDPPYAPLSATSNFTSYSKDGFSAADQERLAATIADLTARGCKIMLSNSTAPLVYDLFAHQPEYRLIEVQSRRNINSKANKRGPVKELLIINY